MTVEQGVPRIDYDLSQITRFIPDIKSSKDPRIKLVLEELGHDVSGVVVWEERKAEKA